MTQFIFLEHQIYSDPSYIYIKNIKYIIYNINYLYMADPVNDQEHYKKTFKDIIMENKRASFLCLIVAFSVK